MTTYRQPMKNNGMVFYDEKEKREMSNGDIFDLIISSFIVGCIVGAVIVIICLINYI
jgi:hypothetical protein